MSSDIPVRITMNDRTIAGVLNTSPATVSLLALLPLELSFTDFGGQEKLAALPKSLDLDGMPIGSSAEPGMIGYYAPDQVLVLFYESVGYYRGIIPLGTFEDVASIKDARPFAATVSSGR
ncbi:cyclophilin-like fold protein [Microbacterium sp. NPDC087868]|uniref:cyclophilin-like fold protein n=1 Tax=Microbacterium sp. NPDC087868 TaxID=3364195 RepID=UPI00384B405A